MLFYNINYIFLNHWHICRCRLGWAGEICTDCQVLPGCQHGYCTKPLECRCHEGYTGLLCQTRTYHIVEGHTNTVQSTGLFKMIVEVLTACHTQYTWDRSVCVFYLIEQHSKFLLHTLQVLYICTLCDSANINTIIEFVPHVSGDGFNGGSDLCL